MERGDSATVRNSCADLSLKTKVTTESDNALHYLTILITALRSAYGFYLILFLLITKVSKNENHFLNV